MIPPSKARDHIDAELRHWYSLRAKWRREGKQAGVRIALASINALQAVRLELLGETYKHQ